MVGRFLVALVLGSGLSQNALAYQWQDNRHYCAVENASFITVDGTRSGRWTGIPKSFFVNIPTCDDYAKSKGLPMKTLEELIKSQEISTSAEQNTVASCAEFASSWIPRYVLEVQGLDVNNQIVTEPQLVSSFPIAGGFSTFVFLDDGYIHYGEYGATSDGNVWFVLKAHCTVIDK